MIEKIELGKPVSLMQPLRGLLKARDAVSWHRLSSRSNALEKVVAFATDNIVLPNGATLSLQTNTSSGNFTCDGSGAFSSGEFLSASSTSSIQTGDVDFFISTWVNPTTNPSAVVMLSKYGGSTSTSDFSFYMLSGVPALRVYDGGTDNLFVNYGGSALSTGTWAHVFAWYSHANKNLYIRVNDGTVYSASVGSRTPLSSTATLQVGTDGSNFLNGTLDGLIFGKPSTAIGDGSGGSLAATICSALYASGSGIAAKDLSSSQKTTWGTVYGYDFDGLTNLTRDSIGTTTLTNHSVNYQSGHISTTTMVAGDGIATWLDVSGSSHNATQSTGVTRPVFNSDNRVIFDSSQASQLLAGGNSDFADAAFTAFVLFKPTSQSTFQTLLNKGDGSTAAGSTWEILSAAGKATIATFDTFYGSTNNSDCTSAQQPTQWQTICAKRVSTSSKALYLNGNLIMTGGDSGNALNSGQHPLGIGNSGVSTTLPFNGEIASVLYYPSALSDADRSTVENWLRDNYSSLLTFSAPSLTVSTFDHAQSPPTQMYIFSTIDGTNFTVPSGISNPVITFPGAGGTGTTTSTAASSVIHYNGNYYVAYEFNDFGGNNDRFGIASSSSLNGPWTWLTDVVILGTPTNGYVWNPRWIIDDSGSVHILVNCESGGTFDTTFQPFMVDALNVALTSWSSPVAISGTFPGNMIDTFLLTPSKSPNGLYNIWYKNETSKYVEYMSSSSLKTGYTVTKSGNWAGWGQMEGVMLMPLSGGGWRIYLDNYTASPSGGFQISDSFDNWATWTVLFNTQFASFSRPGTGSIIN